MRSRLVAFIVLIAALPPAAFGQPAGGNAHDKEAIAKNAQGFIEAFHRGDARAVANHWTSDGDYVGLDGIKLQGREAIETSLKEFFRINKNLKLRIESDSLKFVTPDVAIEEGTSFVFTAERRAPQSGALRQYPREEGGPMASRQRAGYALRAAGECGPSPRL